MVNGKRQSPQTLDLCFVVTNNICSCSCSSCIICIMRSVYGVLQFKVGFVLPLLVDLM